jgi:hypothetical protein
MTSAADFDRIAGELSPDQFAHAIGATKVSEGSYRCPNQAGHSNGDASPSLSISRSDHRTVACCHACGLAGSPVQVAARLWGHDPQAAAERLASSIGIAVPETTKNGKPGQLGTHVATYEYTDEDGHHLFDVLRFAAPKTFRQRVRQGDGGHTWKLTGVRRVLFRLPVVVEAVGAGRVVFVVEGEKDVLRLEALGLVATCNAGGAGKWRRTEYVETLRGARVAILPDNDDPGREHALDVAEHLRGIAEEVRIVELPGLPEKGDVSEWLDAGHTREELGELVRGTAPMGAPDPQVGEEGVTLDDFYAYMPVHKYIFTPSRELWPAASVDARIPPMQDGEEKVKASKWLDRHRPVEQMTWAPGEPEIIEGRLVAHAGWIERPGLRCFNLYRPPQIGPGDPAAAGPWLEHGWRIFPDTIEHMIRWLAHRVQRPHEKVNHAIALIGPQGTGKDSLIEGAIPGVGPWNVWEVGPDALMGRFNPHVKSVILRVSEARDLGDVDRYRLYEHLKVLTAAPPHVLRVDEKNVREYMVPNVTGVVITSNHTDGIYLPADDRRHYVAATELTKDDFTEAYWTDLWAWYHREGFRHVAAYLHSVDLSDFNPKAPPPKTDAFWRVVDAGRAPEDAELADAIDKLMAPDAVTLSEIAKVADASFGDWLTDRKNSRRIPHRMEAAGYIAVRNDDAKDGRWKVGGRRQVIYAQRKLSIRDRIAAAGDLVEAAR